jgi:Autographiviridae exonuclease
VTTLLIDGDILVFQIASACQTSTHWGDGQYSTTADLKEAKGRFRDRVADLKRASGADEVKIALKGEGNFRRRILPTYKANRHNLIPPMLRQPLMEWLLKLPQVISRPLLEGDDVIGILATRGPGEKLIWSTDKDMKQIPGNHWTPEGVWHITEEQADYQHMLQTLTGDATDNYKGLPGCGPVKAARILADTAWPDIYTAAGEAYIRAGLTLDDWLVQARVARILRASDYDFTERKPILWSPSSSK